MSASLKKILRLTDFVMGKLDRDESINCTILAEEFGLSRRQAIRNIHTIAGHYHLPIRWDHKTNSYTIKPPADTGKDKTAWLS